MKYVVVLGDGMADYPLESHEGKTPLELAVKPTIDRLASKGEIGLVKTVPDELKPGSDVANLSVLGYDPLQYYTGRSPLEAASIGVSLKEGDVTFRCNLVTLSEEEPYAQKTMIDYSSDEITTEEAHTLIADLAKEFDSEMIHFHGGISYRHLMVWNGVPLDFQLTPPHDISLRPVTEHLPKGPNSAVLLDFMQRSYALLNHHPINEKRRQRGLHPANSIWIWGEGEKPHLDSFMDKFGLKGSVISAVDLVKGIGICANMQTIDVEGATGNIDTNFEGKAKAAIEALRSGSDFVYLHFEAPDECGHRHETDNKIKSIEYLDSRVLAYLLPELEKLQEGFSIMVLPDHPTPLSLRTHTRDAVPYLIYRSNDIQQHDWTYSEKEAAKTGIVIDPGYTLMQRFLQR